jgi:hypothetical protein
MGDCQKLGQKALDRIHNGSIEKASKGDLLSANFANQEVN